MYVQLINNALKLGSSFPEAFFLTHFALLLKSSQGKHCFRKSLEMWFNYNMKEEENNVDVFVSCR